MTHPITQSPDNLRHGLLLCHLDALWETLPSAQVSQWQTSLSNWTGKSEELRKQLPFLESLAQVREADLDPLRQLALELRANTDDIVLVGSGNFMDLARLRLLFGDLPRPRLHLPRGKEWEHTLLTPLAEAGSRTALVVLGWNPGDPNWDRTVVAGLEWMRERYKDEELTRRVAGVSARPLPQLLDFPLRMLPVSERAAAAPVFSTLGLFPLFLAGYEAGSLLEGARSQIRALEKAWHLDSAVLRMAVLRQVLSMQEGWGETVVMPDRFSEPLGLWLQRLLEPSALALDPPLPYPFPHLTSLDHDPHGAEREHSYEIQLDYGGELPPHPEATQRNRARVWVGMPRLDMYTLGGLLAFFSLVVGLNHRWSGVEYPALEATG